MRVELPNQDLLHHLFHTYYQSAVESHDEDFTSSHWKHYSSLTNVRVGEDGSFSELSGVGFGVYRWLGSKHKILEKLSVVSHLGHLSHRKRLLHLWSVGSHLCEAMGLAPTLDAFRQVCVMELLERTIRNVIPQQRLQILMIGDGYGVLSALFKAIYPDSTIVLIDIGRTLLFQAYFCQRAHAGKIHERVDALALSDMDRTDFIYCPAEKLALLKEFKFNVAVNICSMQEMNQNTVETYFTFMRNNLLPDNLFYCCNREFKEMLGGEISEFKKYPWRAEDRLLLDEYCPWNRYFLSWRPVGKGFEVLGVRVPFINFYDGKIRHRMVVLEPNEKV